MVFECQKPIRGSDKDGSHPDIDGSPAYTDEAQIVEEDRRIKVTNPED